MDKNNLKDKWVICLGGSTSKIPIIEAVKKRGLNCCVIDRNPKCVAKNYSDLFFRSALYSRILSIMIITTPMLIAESAILNAGQYHC